MMRARWLTATILSTCLMMGQGCPAPTPEPIPPAPFSPIPEGVYVGEPQSRIRFYVNGEFVQETFRKQLDTELFGPDGYPLTPDNQPIYVGYTYSEESSLGQATGTITAINAVSNGVRITANGTLTMNIPPDETVVFESEATTTYILKEDGSLAGTGQMSLVGLLSDGTVINMTIESVGVLVRQ